MSTVEVGGRALSVQRRGEGPPVLLVPGMSATAAWWIDEFVEPLLASHELISFDHRGMGESEPAGQGFALDDLAADAVGILDALQIDSAHLVGTSMGGMVAQLIALDHAERVDQLVLACTMPGGRHATRTPRSTVEKMGAAYGRRSREAILRASYEVNLSESVWDDDRLWERWQAIALESPAPIPTIAQQYQAVMGFAVGDRLAEIEAPTLVVHGTDDAVLPHPNGEYLAERIDGARLETLEGTGHALWIERPRESGELIAEFLEG